VTSDSGLPSGSDLRNGDDGTPPIWLTGAWIRQARTFDDGQPTECSDVAWLQVGRWFADFRIPRPGQKAVHPFDVAQASSGRLDVVNVSDRSASVTWRHDLDTEDRAASDPDTAQVALGEGILVESGTGYVEWWRHPDGEEPDATGLVLERLGSTADGDASTGGPDGGERTVTARVVCVGQMAVAVWDTPEPGGAWCTADGDWEPDRLVGMMAEHADSVRALRSGVAGETLPDGWREQRER
jgi:hypothetical protein